MKDETALTLAAAMNRLAAAIERITGKNGLQDGIILHNMANPYNPFVAAAGGNKNQSGNLGRAT